MNRTLLASVVLLFCMIVGCYDLFKPETPDGELSGTVVFFGPVANTRVSLYRIDSSLTPTELLSECVTDERGRYEFKHLRTEGRFLLVADLSGISWVDVQSEGRGVFDDSDQLYAVIPGFQMDEKREISLTVFSTFAAIAGEARTLAGLGNQFETANLAMSEHLGFPIESTVVDVEDLPGALTPSVIYRLVTDNFIALANQIADDAGLKKGVSFTALHLFHALLKDLSSQKRPGVFDGQDDQGLIQLAKNENLFLNSETLRLHFKQALYTLLDTDSRWSYITSTELKNVIATWACSPSSLFLPCDSTLNEIDNRIEISLKAPKIDDVLTGIAEFQFYVMNPLAQIRQIELEWKDHGSQKIEMIDDEHHIARFSFDTTQVLGQDHVDLKLTATDENGLSQSSDFVFKINNLGSATIDGAVLKGPAQHVIVSAVGLKSDGTRMILGQTETDDWGNYALRISEWAGPILFTAGQNSEKPLNSKYLDESSKRYVLWGEHIMSSVLPSFEPLKEQALMITPWSDLAWQMALTRAMDESLENKIEIYLNTLNSIGNFFALAQPVKTILSRRPSDFTEMHVGNVTESDRLMISLVCFSEQAALLSSEIYPDESYRLSALDLLELYRQDLAVDPYLDGSYGQSSLRYVMMNGEEYIVPQDWFRWQLPLACASWLNDSEKNQTGLSPVELGDQLYSMSFREDPLLFNPNTTPREIRSEDVKISLWMKPVALGNECCSQPMTRFTRDDVLSGARLNRASHASEDVFFLLEVHDDIGIVDVDFNLFSGSESNHFRRGDSVLGAESGRFYGILEVHEESTEVIQVVVTDALNQRHEAYYVTHIDLQPPAFTYISPLMDRLDQEPVLYTHETEVLIDFKIDDLTEVSVTVESLTDLAALTKDAGDTYHLVIHTSSLPEGSYEILLNATDSLGQKTTSRLHLELDRTPPILSVTSDELLDHLSFDVDGNIQNPVYFRIDGSGSQVIRRWPSRWSKEDESPCMLRLQLGDDRAPLLPSHQHAHFEIERSIGNDVVSFEWTPNQTEELRSEMIIYAGYLPSDPGAIPFDPMRADFVPIVVHYQIRAIDNAGNSSEIKDFSLVLESIPPPVIAVLETAAPSDLDAINGYEFEMLEEIPSAWPGLFHHQMGEKILLSAFSITNPHDRPISVRLNGAHSVHLMAMSEAVKKVFNTYPLGSIQTPACFFDAGVNTSQFCAYGVDWSGNQFTMIGCERFHVPPSFEFYPEVNFYPSEIITLSPGETVRAIAYLPPSMVEIEAPQWTKCVSMDEPECQISLQTGRILWYDSLLQAWHYGMHYVRWNAVLLQSVSPVTITPFVNEVNGRESSITLQILKEIRN